MPLKLLMKKFQHVVEHMGKVGMILENQVGLVMTVMVQGLVEITFLIEKRSMSVIIVTGKDTI